MQNFSQMKEFSMDNENLIPTSSGLSKLKFHQLSEILKKEQELRFKEEEMTCYD